MPRDIDIDKLRALLARGGTQLIDVLPEAEYAVEHLPHAINVPLKSMNEESVRELDPAAPTVVYCWDDKRDMSPRAAWQLEAMRFTDVYHYVNGKVEWMLRGQPMQGTRPHHEMAGEVATTERLHTCLLRSTVGESARAMERSGDTFCLVLNEEGVVLGRLRKKHQDANSDAAVEEVMETGPTTVRPNEPAKPAARTNGASRRIRGSGDFEEGCACRTCAPERPSKPGREERMTIEIDGPEYTAFGDHTFRRVSEAEWGSRGNSYRGLDHLAGRRGQRARDVDRH